MNVTPEIHLTDEARRHMLLALQAEDLTDFAIRVEARKLTPIKYEYSLFIEGPEERRAADLEIDATGIKIWVDPNSAELLGGATIDYLKEGSKEGFKFNNPNEPQGWTDPISQKFQALLDAEINPGLASHGGRVDLLDFTQGIARVRMSGGCQGCGMAAQTLRDGVERRIKEEIPEVDQIIDDTDHNAGTNPYYS